MSFHTLAFFESIDNTPNVDIQPVADQFFFISNNHFLPTDPWDLLAAYAGSATLNRARFSSPTLNLITSPFIIPTEDSLLPVTDPNIADYRDRPLRFSPNEAIVLEATSDVAMGSENFSALIFLTKRVRPLPPGRIFTIRGTGVTTLVANVWSQVAITWANDLPDGVYAVVGLVAQGATAIGARLTFFDQKERPGTLAVTDVNNRTAAMFMKGGLGEWGRFDSFIFPLMEFYANAADTAQVVYMDIIKVA